MRKSRKSYNNVSKVSAQVSLLYQRTTESTVENAYRGKGVSQQASGFSKLLQLTGSENGALDGHYLDLASPYLGRWIAAPLPEEVLDLCELLHTRHIRTESSLSSFKRNGSIYFDLASWC